MPLLLCALALLGLAGVTFSLASADTRSAREPLAGLPFHNVAPGLASDSGSAAFLETATPGATPGGATPSPTVGNACGSGHAGLINFNDAAAAALSREPIAATVGQLATAARPPVPGAATRTAPFETTVYSVDVSLVSMTQASNRAVSVVVTGVGAGISMRVTLPDYPCTEGAPAADRGSMLGARTALRLACGDAPSSGKRNLRGTATITGVGFWGTSAIEGAASNGAELGPLLSFTFTDTGSCDPTQASPTPTASPVPAVQEITVGNSAGSSNVPPGGAITATIYTHPPTAGVECRLEYASPPPVTLIPDPALVPKTTGADGSVSWAWNIPADSPLGVGRVQAFCQDKQAFGQVHVGAP